MRLKHLVPGGVLFLFPLIGRAQTEAVNNFKEGLTAAAGGAGLATAYSPANVVGNLISAVLGLSGIILMGVLVYAGILYMQGGQDEGKIKEAKAWITNSVIGIVLVASAYAIAQFVLDSLTRATAG